MWSDDWADTAETLSMLRRIQGGSVHLEASLSGPITSLWMHRSGLWSKQKNATLKNVTLFNETLGTRTMFSKDTSRVPTVVFEVDKVCGVETRHFPKISEKNFQNIDCKLPAKCLFQTSPTKSAPYTLLVGVYPFTAEVGRSVRLCVKPCS